MKIDRLKKNDKFVSKDLDGCCYVFMEKEIDVYHYRLFGTSMYFRTKKKINVVKL